MTERKLLTLTQLRAYLGKYLPNAPSAHRIYAALDAGCPHFKDSVSGKKLYDGEAVLAWWLSPSKAAEVSPEDVAAKARRRVS